MHSKLFRIIVFLIPLLFANAEIFMRISRNSKAILKSLGGSEVYHSSVQINGCKGELNLFVFNERSDVTASRLAKKLKLPRPKAASAIMLDVSGKTLTRYFVIPAPNLQNVSLVTALEQKSSAFSRTAKGAPPWPTNIPVLNASVQFTARCSKTRTTFLSAVSQSSTPEQAVTEASAILAGEGWTEMRPTTPTFRIFIQGVKQRVVFSDENSITHEVSINILQRDGSKQ